MSRTILVVDDTRTVRNTLALILRNMGVDAVLAMDGRQALGMIRNRAAEGNGFDMVITDVNMPVMDGLSMIRELRQDGRFENLPILVLTSMGSDEVRAEGKAAGANGWVVKPVKPATLKYAVDKFAL